MNRRNQLAERCVAGAAARRCIEGHDLCSAGDDRADFLERRRNIRLEARIFAFDQSDDGKRNAGAYRAQVLAAGDANCDGSALLRRFCHRRNDTGIVQRRTSPSLDGNDQTAADRIEQRHSRSSVTLTACSR